MNRFEKYPRITLVVASFVIVVATLAVIEWTLTLFHEALAIERPSEQVNPRHLHIREWLPGRVSRFRAPENRKQDPLGPVDEVYELRIDQSGFIEPSTVHDAPDMEIAFLGGSTTECLYVRPEKRFPYLVGRLLEQRTGLRTNALNAGRSGNHTLHSTINYLGKLAPRQPRFVVLMHATNDIGVLGGHKTYWNRDRSIAIVQDRSGYRERGALLALLTQIRNKMVPYTFAVARQGYKVARENVRQLFRSDEPAAKPAVEPRQAREIRSEKPVMLDDAEIKRRKEFRKFFAPALVSFVRLAKAWRSQPVLMTQVLVTGNARRAENIEGAFLSPEALARGNFDYASFSSMHEYANAIIRYVAQREGALLIDLSASRQWGDEDVYDGIHFTETGSQRVANIIADALFAHIAAGPRSVTDAVEPASKNQD